MLPEYDFSFQLYPRHDAHVIAYWLNLLQSVNNPVKIMLNKLGIDITFLTKDHYSTITDLAIREQQILDSNLGGVHRHQLVFAGYATSNIVHSGFYVDALPYMHNSIEDLDSNTDQTYKKRKHIPNNQEAQNDRKAKLLAKNKFFNK